MSVLYVVVPAGVDDPQRPSGGNVYDRRVIDRLVEIGWSVEEHAVPVRGPEMGSYPAALAEVLSPIPDEALLLVDGLVASAAPDHVAAMAGRLRVVVLVHMPVGEATPDLRAGEAAMLSSVAAVVTTSRWTRSWLLEEYGLSGDRVHVAAPGVDPADVAPGTASGGELVCVGAVTAAKGHDVLFEALASVEDLAWHCVCAGSLDIEPDFVDRLRHQAADAGIATRVELAGPLTRAGLDAVYAGADVLVVASRAETYGMVVTEALARGLPVIGTDAGGLREALGRTVDGDRPGMLVPAGDADALAAALRTWLEDPGRRRDLRRAARARRATLSSWSETGSCISRVLTDLSG